MARIENHKYTIEEAFKECFYIVPDYQREYVWTEKEVRQLLDDIDEQIDAGTAREYFIGTVLVAPTGQKAHCEVIDGQQRLTTLFLLLCALRRRFAGQPQRQVIDALISTSYTDTEGNTRTNLKLEPRYEHAGELVAKLVALDAAPDVVRSGVGAANIPSFGSLENLLGAYETTCRYLDENYDQLQKLKKLLGIGSVPGDRVEFVIAHYRPCDSGIHHATDRLDGAHLRGAAINEVSYKDRLPIRVAPSARHMAISHLSQQGFQFVSMSVDVADDVVAHNGPILVPVAGAQTRCLRGANRTLHRNSLIN